MSICSKRRVESSFLSFDKWKQPKYISLLITYETLRSNNLTAISGTRNHCFLIRKSIDGLFLCESDLNIPINSRTMKSLEHATRWAIAWLILNVFCKLLPCLYCKNKRKNAVLIIYLQTWKTKKISCILPAWVDKT